jgi:hypothetical protein
VVLHDNNITVQRPDIAVPDDVRREQLTQRFLDGLRDLSADGECVLLFFDAVEKMSDITYQWLWEQLLPPVRDELLVEPKQDQTVVDLAYYPDGRPTALVEAARTAGCEVLDGLEALVRQGAASSELWTGVPPPLDVMRAAVRSA